MDLTYLLVQSLAGILIGTLNFVAGMWFFNKYFLPRMAPQMARDVIKEVKEMPEVKEVLKRTNGIIDQLEPLLQKLETLNITKTQKDLEPLIKMLKKIDYEQLLHNIEQLTTSATKQPKIPKPD